MSEPNQALLDPAMAAALAGNEGSVPFGASASEVMPGSIVLDPAVIAAFSDAPGIRLNHLLNDRHDIRMPDGKWISFVGHVAIVDTEEEAQFIEQKLNGMAGEDIIVRDDLAVPIPCMLCQAKGDVFTTRCLALYLRHMPQAHG